MREVYVKEFIVQSNTKRESLLWLKTDNPFEPGTVKAGQFVTLSIPGMGTKRIYSIASSPTKDYISFIIKVYPTGEFTQQLLSYLGREGQILRLEVSELSGFFNLDTFFKKEVNNSYVATGTGIAPLLSYDKVEGVEIDAYLGVRELKDLEFYKQVFQKEGKEEEYRNLIKCVSKPSKEECGDVTIYEGRVTSIFNLFSTSDRVALCGLDSMISEISNNLIEFGLPFDYILTEIFFV